MRVLIVGCGYVGRALGAELARQGHQVFGVRRSPPSASTDGISYARADILNPEELNAIQGPFDWVVNTTASGGGDAADYQRIYLQGTRNLIAWLQPQGIKKFVYTSSTGVYGQDDGSQVKESSPTDPSADTAKVLVETEKTLLEAVARDKFPAVILRVAGIYGPDRGHLFRQYVKNEARMAGKGERIMNMIHREDLIGIILAALKSGRAGEVYNAVDDEPVTQLTYFRWLSETLGKWMPPFAAESEAGPGKRAATNKKVMNRKLKMELGYVFKYPTFRQGYTAEIMRLEKAGELNIVPDAR